MKCACTGNYVCSWCTYGPSGTFICNDPTCCTPSKWNYDTPVRQAAGWAKLKNLQEEFDRLKEKQYQEQVASLDKLSGAVRMFRTWKLLPDGSLMAMVADHTWKPGENVTLATGRDASKDSGFYGFAGLDELKRQEKEWWDQSQSGEPRMMAYPTMGGGVDVGTMHYYVCGTMLCYGHVKISEKGGRAQKAWPEYIIEPDGSDPDFGMLVLNAAERYGMQIITVKDASELETGPVPWVKGEKK